MSHRHTHTNALLFDYHTHAQMKRLAACVDIYILICFRIYAEKNDYEKFNYNSLVKWKVVNLTIFLIKLTTIA